MPYGPHSDLVRRWLVECLFLHRSKVRAHEDDPRERVLRQQLSASLRELAVRHERAHPVDAGQQCAWVLTEREAGVQAADLAALMACALALIDVVPEQIFEQIHNLWRTHVDDPRASDRRHEVLAERDQIQRGQRSGAEFKSQTRRAGLFGLLGGTRVAPAWERNAAQMQALWKHVGSLKRNQLVLLAQAHESYPGGQILTSLHRHGEQQAAPVEGALTRSWVAFWPVAFASGLPNPLLARCWLVVARATLANLLRDESIAALVIEAERPWVQAQTAIPLVG